jgi:hypothetical protein
MFNWSGNKGSFMGDISFYGKTGLDFYTMRKVSCLVFSFLGLTCDRLPLPSGLRLTRPVTALPLTCPSFIRGCRSIPVIFAFICTNMIYNHRFSRVGDTVHRRRKATTDCLISDLLRQLLQYRLEFYVKIVCRRFCTLGTTAESGCICAPELD